MIQESLRRTADFVCENPEQFQKMGTIAHYYSLSCLIGENDQMALICLYRSSSHLVVRFYRGLTQFILGADLRT